MSNDLLPSPDLVAEPAKDAGAVGALDAGPGSERGIFTAYRAADALPEANDARTLLQTIARVEAAMRDAPSRMTVGLLRGLADIAAAIKQIESVLSANEAPAPDVHFAVENMHDIAMAVRQRDVEAALCDTLDAAIREVGDAIVRSEVAAARTQGAAALLRELARRMDQLIALGGDTAAGAAEKIDLSSVTPGRFDDTAAPEPLADAALSDAEQSPLPQPLPLAAALPDKQAASGLGEARANLSEPTASSSLLRVLNLIEETAPASDQPSAPLIAETSASLLAVSAATDITQANAPAAPISRQPPLDNGTHARRTARAAATGPLAALNALNDEEIIALFS